MPHVPHEEENENDENEEEKEKEKEEEGGLDEKKKDEEEEDEGEDEDEEEEDEKKKELRRWRQSFPSSRIVPECLAYRLPWSILRSSTFKCFCRLLMTIYLLIFCSTVCPLYFALVVIGYLVDKIVLYPFRRVLGAERVDDFVHGRSRPRELKEECIREIAGCTEALLGKSAWANFVYMVFVTHPLLSFCFAAKGHPFSRTERANMILLLASVGFYGAAQQQRLINQDFDDSSDAEKQALNFLLAFPFVTLPTLLLGIIFRACVLADYKALLQTAGNVVEERKTTRINRFLSFLVTRYDLCKHTAVDTSNHELPHDAEGYFYLGGDQKVMSPLMPVLTHPLAGHIHVTQDANGRWQAMKIVGTADLLGGMVAFRTLGGDFEGMKFKAQLQRRRPEQDEMSFEWVKCTVNYDGTDDKWLIEVEGATHALERATEEETKQAVLQAPWFSHPAWTKEKAGFATGLANFLSRLGFGVECSCFVASIILIVKGVELEQELKDSSAWQGTVRGLAMNWFLLWFPQSAAIFFATWWWQHLRRNSESTQELVEFLTDVVGSTRPCTLKAKKLLQYLLQRTSHPKENMCGDAISAFCERVGTFDLKNKRLPDFLLNDYCESAGFWNGPGSALGMAKQLRNEVSLKIIDSDGGEIDAATGTLAATSRAPSAFANSAPRPPQV